MVYFLNIFLFFINYLYFINMEQNPTENHESSNHLINVYFRTADKKGSLLRISKTPSYNELINIVNSKLRISNSEIILIHRGQQLSQGNKVELQQKSIIHIINSQHIKKQQIKISVQDVLQKHVQRFQITTNLLIKDFIQKQLNSVFKSNSEETVLIYVGKHLNPQKSFSEELVEDNSQILYLSNSKKFSGDYKSKKLNPKQLLMGNCNAMSQTLQNPDPLFDLIIQQDLKLNQWPAIIDQHKKNPDHQSLMAKNMSKELFDKLKDHKTPNGWTISRAINTGTLYPDSFIGCHAGDLESYHEFKEFFYPVIQGCHFGFKMDGSMKHITDIDSSKITTKLEQTALNKIISTRIRCARNLKMFPLNTVGTKESRNDVLDLVKKVVAELPVDLQGQLYPLQGMTEQKRKQLIDLHFLFRGADKMQAASGYHAFWPSGRGIFLSHDRKFIMWINEGDHLRIISMQNGGNIQSVFDRFSRAVSTMEDTIKKITKTEQAFLHDPVIGMIACCPSNLGTCLRGSVHILLPKLIEKIGFKEIDKIARKMGCQARGSSGEHSKVIDRIDISNWRRLGFPEYKLVEDMMKCANELAKMQDEA